MQLFDGEDRIERELRGDGKLIIYNPSLSLIGTTTPTMLSRYMSDTEWESGLMARFIALTPTEKDMPFVVSDPSPELDRMTEGLKGRLHRIHSAFPQHQNGKPFIAQNNPFSYRASMYCLNQK